MYAAIGDAILGCAVGVSQGLSLGLFQNSSDTKQQRAQNATRPATETAGPGLLSRAVQKLLHVCGAVAHGWLGFWFYLTGCVAGATATACLVMLGMWVELSSQSSNHDKGGGHRGRDNTARKQHASFTTTGWFKQTRSSTASGTGRASAAKSSASGGRKSGWFRWVRSFWAPSRIAAYWAPSRIAAYCPPLPTYGEDAADYAARVAEEYVLLYVLKFISWLIGMNWDPNNPRILEQRVNNSSMSSAGVLQGVSQSGRPGSYDPSWASELHERGVEALGQNNLKGALKLFNDGLKLKPANKKLSASLHNNKGYTYMRQKLYALAIVECCKAVDLNRDMWEPYWVKHLAWLRLGVYTMAAQDWLLAQQKGGPDSEQIVPRSDNVRYSTLLGLGNNGRIFTKTDVKKAWRALMMDCHSDTAPRDQRHEHQRHVTNILCQHLNDAKERLG